MDITKEIREQLLELQDEEYRDFQKRLIPGEAADTIIGVRTPALRKLAKKLAKQESVCDFLQNLPHTCFEENQLHAFIIGEEKDFQTCLEQVERFLPYVNNWATCDQLSPKVFGKEPERLLPAIRCWISAEPVYTVRFGIGMLMRYFLDDFFQEKYLDWVAEIRSEEYYINMMIAWYFATALAKQYDSTLPYIEKQRLAHWTHNKAIQKAIESNRITKEQKAYLRTWKVKGKRKRI
ncbi:MAG: DNA alkylation repair protein [Lachnospiraceae bacterium]|nr:DNA alkylation repair protein [Lachnospiraceae bacterium]